MEGQEQVPVVPVPEDVRQVVAPVAARDERHREEPVLRQNAPVNQVNDQVNEPRVVPQDAPQLLVQEVMFSCLQF